MAKKTTNGDDDQNDDGTATESDEDEPTGDDDTTATESDEDIDDEDSEEQIIASLTPAQAKLFTATQEKLARANASSRRRRLALQALREGAGVGTQPKPTAPKDKKDSPATFDPEAFKADLLASIKGEQEAGKAQTVAEKALRKAGLILPDDEDAADRKIQRVLRMIDLKNTPLDEIQDEIDDLKADNPELFGRVKRKRPAAGGVAGPSRVTSSKPSSRIGELFD